MRINWFQGSLPRAALFQMQMSFNPNLLRFEVLHTVCQETKAFLVICAVPDQRKDLDIASMAVERPWDEDPFTMSEEVMKNISLEVVREKLLDHVHQEIPYEINHRLMEWKELRDGSLRIEQHLITHKQSQRKIIVGKNGSKIGRIGVEANEELRSIFKRNVHLILQVRVK